MIKYTESQQEAINTLNQNLQIIACAGSGKTQVISQRIVNLLKQDNIEPKNIIAFTYTEKAASELKSRVVKLCKEQIPELKGMVEMYIGTIHSWCLDVIRNHIYKYQKFSVLSDIKLKLFIDRYYETIGMKDLDMNMFNDTYNFINVMTILRESELSGKAVPENLQIALNKYESTLYDNAFFDFTMIMTHTLKYIKKESNLREKLKENLKYLIVDEYQDVNPIQEEIIKEIYKIGCNICVVGDDDQTIYQWRGSDLKYILNFEKRYDNVKSIKLMDNFRSSKGIVDIAETVIQNNQKRLDKQMIAFGSQSYEKGDILYNRFNDIEEENEFIIHKIKQLRGVEFSSKGIKRGIDYSDVVILLRKWNKASELATSLKDANIPFIVGGVNKLFETDEVKASVNIFRYLSNDLTDPTILINSWKMLSQKIDTTKLFEAIKNLEKEKPDEDTFYGEFILQDIFWDFLQQSGITENSFDNGEIIFYNLGMFSQVINDYEVINFTRPALEKIKNFLEFIKYGAIHYYPEGWLNNTYKNVNAVRIMTIFQSKGLEFPVVFIPYLNKNYLPAQKLGGKNTWHTLDRDLIINQKRFEGDIEDERRLFYVAITRSQKFLLLSSAPTNKRNEKKESEFVLELSRSDYWFSSKIHDFSKRIHTKPEPLENTQSVVLNFSILKNYFDCSYKFKMSALYGFCNPLSIRIGYGRGIHNVLMEIHKQSLLGIKTKTEKIPDLVDTHVHIPYASNRILRLIKKKSIEVIKEYLRLNEKNFDSIEYAEKEIQFDLSENIIINGRIDLIKKKNLDGTYQTSIIDFKSTEDAQTYDVSMEQLSLYALGYEELSGEKADILELYNLDENRPYKQEIVDYEFNNIRKQIIEASKSIQENKLSKTEDNKQCWKCFYKQLCKE
jgi:DNA helicase-2/ATP-dependent DNA helicase PcrA